MKNTILIIDRDTQMLKRLRSILSGEGFDLMTATDIATAKEIVKKVEISYVLLEPEYCSEFRYYFHKSKISQELKEPEK